MDKVQKINLGGYSFIIENGAYQQLKSYLDQVRFNTQRDAELIRDVELRIAELFKEQLEFKEVIEEKDVLQVINRMGPAHTFATEEESASFPRKKKLYRDPNDKMLGGVCAGLAHYFSIDTTIVRLIFASLPILDILFLGISTVGVVFTYILLWIIIPLAPNGYRENY